MNGNEWKRKANVAKRSAWLLNITVAVLFVYGSYYMISRIIREQFLLHTILLSLTYVITAVVYIYLILFFKQRKKRKYDLRLSIIPSELPNMKFISRCIYEQKPRYYKTIVDGAGRCYTEFLDHDNIERGRVKLALDMKHIIEVVSDGYYITFISTLEDSQWQKFLNRIKKKAPAPPYR